MPEIANRLLTPFLWLLGALLAGYLWLCLRTSRVVWLKRPELWGKESAVFAGWHCRLWQGPLVRPPNGTTYSFVNWHPWGQLVGMILRWHGIEPITRSDNPLALGALARALQRGDSVVITPDGPTGPYRRAKPGATHLAKLAGVALLPCGASARWGVELPNKDRTLVLLPFNTLFLAIGTPLQIPSAAALTVAIDELQREADAAAGRAPIADARG